MGDRWERRTRLTVRQNFAYLHCQQRKEVPIKLRIKHNVTFGRNSCRLFHSRNELTGNVHR